LSRRLAIAVASGNEQVMPEMAAVGGRVFGVLGGVVAFVVWRRRHER